jgi:hypothetical protein
MVAAPKWYTWNEDDAVRTISIKGMSAQWADHRALIVADESEGASSVSAMVRFGEDIKLRSGWISYLSDCSKNCSLQIPDIVADSSWCVALGVGADGSMLLGCVTAPNGLEGGLAELASVCAPGPAQPVSLLVLAYKDSTGAWTYESSMIPAPSRAGPTSAAWIDLSMDVTQQGSQASAHLSAQYDGQAVSLTTSFEGSLDPLGLAGVQVGTMPQTICTALNGRPIRSFDMISFEAR